MNDEPTTPLPPDVVDELLSAEIDGELAAAAVDLRLDPATVPARLAATPGTEDRRAALLRARDLGAEVVPLDDATTARLVSVALAHAPADELTARRNSRRMRVLAGIGVAAAIAVVIMAVSVMGESNDDSSQVASSPSAETDADGARVEESETANDASLALADLGEVSDPAVLRERLDQAVLRYGDSADAFAALPRAAQDSAGEDDASADASEGAATESTKSAGAPSDQPSLPQTGVVSPLPDDAGYADCLAGYSQDYGNGNAPSLTATASYNGQPAIVLAYDVDDGRQVLVVSRDGCTLFLAQLLT